MHVQTTYVYQQKIEQSLIESSGESPHLAHAEKPTKYKYIFLRTQGPESLPAHLLQTIKQVEHDTYYLYVQITGGNTIASLLQLSQITDHRDRGNVSMRPLPKQELQNTTKHEFTIDANL